MSNVSPMYKKAIDTIRERRDQTLAAWDQFIEAIDFDDPDPRFTETTFEASPADKRDGCINAYDDAIDYLLAGGPNARQHARVALERAAALEDEAGMVLRARSAMLSI